MMEIRLVLDEETSKIGWKLVGKASGTLRVCLGWNRVWFDPARGQGWSPWPLQVEWHHSTKVESTVDSIRRRSTKPPLGQFWFWPVLFWAVFKQKKGLNGVVLKGILDHFSRPFQMGFQIQKKKKIFWAVLFNFFPL